MIAILPVFLNPSETFWHLPEFNALLRQLLRTVCQFTLFERIYLFSNDPDVLSMVDPRQMESIFLELDVPASQPEFLPRGTREALDFIEKESNFPYDQVAIIGHKNPFLNAQMLQEAHRRFIGGRHRLLFSGVRSVDHPVQLQAYYNIVDAGMIYILDSPECARSYLHKIRQMMGAPDDLWPKDRAVGITRPFHYSWRQKDLRRESVGGVYVQRQAVFRVFFVPVKDQLLKDSQPISLLWIKVNDETARVLFWRKDLKRLLAGATTKTSALEPAGVSINQTVNWPVLLRSPDNRLHIAGLPSDTGVHPDPEYRLDLIVLPTSVPPTPESIRMTLAQPAQPVLLSTNTTQPGQILYTLLRAVTGHDTYDIAEPYACRKKLWEHGFNLATGQRMTGRQHFPDVFEPDGTFCFVQKETIAKMNQALATGQGACHVLPPEKSVKIETRLDYLHYKAILRAQMTDTETTFVQPRS